MNWSINWSVNWWTNWSVNLSVNWSVTWSYHCFHCLLVESDPHSSYFPSLGARAAEFWENLGQTNLFTSFQLLWCVRWLRQNRQCSGLHKPLQPQLSALCHRDVKLTPFRVCSLPTLLESVNQREFIYYSVLQCLFPDGSLRRWWWTWCEFKTNF